MYGRKKFIDYNIKDAGEYEPMLANDLAGPAYMRDQRGAGFAVAPRNDNPVVYFEITSSGGRRLPNGTVTEPQNLGRLYFELRKDLVPVAAANFFDLCSGLKGVGADGIRYHFKGIRIHRIVKDLLFESGDLLDSEGMCSRSVYNNGGYFKDENFIFKHAGAGCISYCNRGPDTNGSLFQVTFTQNSDLDGQYVVFGSLASEDSYTCLTKINSFGTDTGTPKEEIRIVDCGIAWEKE